MNVRFLTVGCGVTCAGNDYDKENRFHKMLKQLVVGGTEAPGEFFEDDSSGGTTAATVAAGV